MTKTMHAPEVGALDKIIQAKKTSRLALSQNGVSRETLKKINNGSLTKEETLVRVADMLGVPLAHLLPTKNESHSDAVGMPLTTDEMIKRTVGSTGQTQPLTLTQMASCSEIHELNDGTWAASEWQLATWNIDIESVDNLKNLEMKMAWIIFPNNDAEEDNSLTGQLNKMLYFKVADELIKELNNKDIRIYYGVYTYWNRVLDIPYRWEDVGIQTFIFESQKRIYLLVSAKNEPFLKINISVGFPPPKSIDAGETPIIVNGCLVEYQPNEDIPF